MLSNIAPQACRGRKRQPVVPRIGQATTAILPAPYSCSYSLKCSALKSPPTGGCTSLLGPAFTFSGPGSPRLGAALLSTRAKPATFMKLPDDDDDPPSGP